MSQAASRAEQERLEKEEAFAEEVDKEIQRLRSFYLRLVRASHIRVGESVEVDNMRITSNVTKIMASSQVLLRMVHQVRTTMLLQESPTLKEAVGAQAQAFEDAFAAATTETNEMLRQGGDAAQEKGAVAAPDIAPNTEAASSEAA